VVLAMFSFRSGRAPVDDGASEDMPDRLLKYRGVPGMAEKRARSAYVPGHRPIPPLSGNTKPRRSGVWCRVWCRTVLLVAVSAYFSKYTRLDSNQQPSVP
jgi:hypothetical protein